MKYLDLPTKKNQFLILSVSIFGYAILLLTGDLLFPDLDDATKKRLAQGGVVTLYLATLSAGLGFVWASKGRQNERAARSAMHDSEEKIKILTDQTKQLGISYEAEIQKAKDAVSEATRQIKLVGELPKVYEWCGAVSLILVAVGTLLCFIGAG